MRNRPPILPALPLVLLAAALHAQMAITKDAAIEAALKAVEPARLEETMRALVAFGTRHTLSDVADEKRGIGAARRWIKERLEQVAKGQDGVMSVAFDPHQAAKGPRVPEGAEVVNVLATIVGSDPDRLVIVSGHFDSRNSKDMDAKGDAPGADDDASGTAVVMESARVLAGLRPRATVVFACLAGEEQGLLGAEGYAKKAREAGWRIEAVLNNDIVGGVTGQNGRRENGRVRLFSEGVPSGPLNDKGRPAQTIVGSDNDASSRQLARYLKLRAESYLDGFEVTLIFRQDRYLRGGDHKAFNNQGFAAVRFTEVNENYAWQHQDVREQDGRKMGDLPENLDYEFVRRVTQVNVAGLAEIALAPAAPRNVRVLNSQLTPDTELRWNASPEEDLAGYGILLRRTHEPLWTERRALPKGQTSVVLEGLSKDDWYFAVEAFDAAGHRSLPVYPTPATR